MKKFLVSFAVLGVAVLFPIYTSYASPILSGSADYAGDSEWTATVYWNVYAPDDSDNPLGTMSYYAYFYRIEHTGGTSLLKQFTVGNTWGAPIVSASSIDYNSGIAPDDIDIDPDSTSYTYDSDGDGLIGPGEHSDWMYLTSWAPPGMVSGSLQNGGKSDDRDVPGPVLPEPTSMLLLGVGLIGLAGRSIRKRFKA